MSKQRRHESPSVELTPPAATLKLDESESNEVAQEELRSAQALGDGGQATAAPPDPSSPGAPPTGDPFAGGGGGPVPYKDELEAALGVPLDGIRAITGQAQALHAMGADAAARGDTVVFADTSPQLIQVAEEVIHTLQAGPSAGSTISSPSDGSEVEAKKLAAQIASGQTAGPIRATASAAIQRDDTTPPGEGTREVTVSGATVVVYPDTRTAALPERRLSGGKWHVFERDLAAFRTDLAAMQGLRTRVLEACDQPEEYTVHYIERAVRGASPGARRLLLGDPTFLADPRFTASPQLLVRVAAANSAKLLFDESLRLARSGGTTDLVAFVRSYARSHAAESRQALAEGALEGSVRGMTDAQRHSAIAYMVSGGADHAPITRLRIALQARDIPAFMLNFALVSVDTTARDSLKNDATFLNQVRDRLGETCWQLVQNSLIHTASADATLGLTVAEREALRVPAGTCARLLHAEFDATVYASDSNVLAALRGYFASVDQQLAAVEGAEAKRTKKEEARTLLKDTYHDTYRTSIATGLQAGVTGGTLTQCLALINSRPADTVAAVSAARSASTDPALEVRLTRREREQLSAPLRSAVDVLKDEADDMVFDDAPATRAIRTYRNAVRRTIPVDSQAAVDVINAANSRRAEAHRLLPETFESETRKTLASVLESGLSGRTFASTQSQMDADSVAEVVVAEATTYAAPAGNELTAAEMARVLPLARRNAQSIQSVVDDWIVGDGTFYFRVYIAHSAIRSAVSPEQGNQRGAVDGARTAVWDRKTRAAMGVLKDQYDAQFGSLTGDLHRYLQDTAKRTQCLTWLGTSGRGAALVQESALGGLQATGMTAPQQQEWASNSRQFTAKVTSLAGKFADEMDDMVVHDSVIMQLCSDFADLKREYASLATGNPEFTDGSYLLALEQAYTPLRGSLRRDIVSYVDRGRNANTCFSRLGLGNAQNATVQVDETGLAASEIELARELQPSCRGMFRYLEGLGGAQMQWRGQRGQRNAAVGAAFVQRIVRIVPEGQRQAFVGEFYEQEHHIRLGDHIGRVFPEDHRAGIQEAAPWLSIGPYGRRPSNEQVNTSQQAALAEARGSNAPAELRFDAQRVRPGFTLELAAQRARDINARLRMGVGGTNRATLTNLILGQEAGGGNRGMVDERRVVNALYKRMYGVDIRVDIQSAMRMYSAGETGDVEALATGEEPGLVADVRTQIRLGTDSSLNNIYSHVLMASQSDRTALLADPLIFGEIRAKWDHEAMDRAYRSATGELTLADMLRTRDTSTEWYTFGLGTDEAGSRNDVKLFFRWLKRELHIGQPVTPGESPTTRAAALDTAVKTRARQMLADPDTRQMLDNEFESGDLLQMEQLIAGAGTQSRTDQANQHAVDNSDDALLTQIRAMTDAERTTNRADPAFIDRVRTALSGAKQQEAMSLLFGTQASSELPTLDAALVNRDNVDNYQENDLTEEEKENRDERETFDRTAMDYGGRNAVFDAVLAMDSSELALLANDPIRVARLRAAVRRNPADARHLENLLNGVTVGTGSAARSVTGASSLSETAPAANTNLTDEQKEAVRQGLTLRHIVDLQRAASRGVDHLFAAAQRVYNEEGETTVSFNPTHKEKLFGLAQRRIVWSAVRSDVADCTTEGTADFDAVGNAVKRTTDPSTYRITQAFSGMDNDRIVDEAIAAAGTDTLTNEWSNILKPGPESGTMKAAYDAFVIARTRRDSAVARRDAAGPNGEVTADMDTEVRGAEEALAIKHYAFRDFRLDVSTEIATLLSQGGGAHLNRRNGTADFAFFATGDARYQALIAAVRTRILALKSNDIAGALGISTEGLDIVGPLTVEDSTRRDDIAELMNDDRKDRSQATHAADTYMQSRGQGSVVDGFTNADGAMDQSYAAYLTRVGRSVEGSGNTVGSIDSQEHAANEQAAAEFQGAVADYRAARTALRDVLTWIAIAVVGAVTTALTGPGGPTLMAAMISAAASAGAVAVINEGTMGRDYEFVQEGLKNVVKDTAVTALTFGLNKAGSMAVERNGFLQSGADKLARFQAWEQGLASGATQTFSNGAQYVLYSGGKAALTTAYSDMQGAVVGSLSPEEWKYGFRQGVSHGRTTFDRAFDSMPANMMRATLSTLAREGIITLSSAQYNRVFGTPPGLDGDSNNTDPIETQEVSGLNALRDATTANLSPDALARSGGTYTLDWALGRARAGNLRFDSSDVGAFMLGYAKNRAGAIVSDTGTRVQQQQTSQAAARLFAQHADAFNAGADLHGLPPAAARGHFRHFLLTGVVNHERGFEEWQAAWAGVHQTIQRRTDGADTTQADQYRAYVLSDPTQINTRLAYTMEQVTNASARADRQASLIQQSSQYQSMSVEQREFYDGYLTNRARLNLNGSNDSMDVREASGAAAFQSAFNQTKKAMVLTHCATQIGALSTDGRREFQTLLDEATRSGNLPVLSPSNEADSQAAAQQWFNRRMATVNRGDTNAEAGGSEG